MQNITRYSDEELALFKIHIELKLEKAKEDYQFIRSQIEDVSTSMEDEHDPLDDSSNSMDLERLQIMALRHQHHIRDLENALLRVRNKTFGICIITNELIDKRRLMAVPTTTKCLAAKNAMRTPEKKVAKPVKKNGGAPKIITKVITKKPTVAPIVLSDDLEEEDDDLLVADIFDEEAEGEDMVAVEETSEVDLDDYSEEDIY